MAARKRRRAHPIDDQGIRRFALSRIKAMLMGQETVEGCPSELQLREERLEPLRMFVVDGDGFITGSLLGIPHSGTSLYQLRLNRTYRGVAD